ncbi:unnamed protein product [Caenorhabditis angaria]|uniref:G-protein coupled receptors family 3 profile domain-containing protein n=1 Tax=Caenorhabditis angaria TaxID=860376 RepID=A0A9P1IPB3_9PELO|nr:unnamed protein product [Caenorhabditis angaria]
MICALTALILALAAISSAHTIKQISVPGEITLGGLFPIHEAGRNQSCGKIKADQGVQRMVAMLFALEQVNRERILIPEASLGAQILDTCSVDSYALEQTLEFIKSVMSNGQGVTCEDKKAPAYSRQPVVAVVGAAGSQVSVMVASMLQLFKIPQVSYSSTGAELSEKPRFQFFSRVVPPDNLQALVMAKVIKALGWNYVHAVADTGSYGERGMDSFKTVASSENICIDGDVHKISRRHSDQAFKDLLLRMKKGRKARGVVMFVDEDNLKKLLKNLDELIIANHTELDGHFWFVASDSWGIKQSVVKDVAHRTYGTITIAPSVRTEEGYIEFYEKLEPKGYVFLEEFFEYLGCANQENIKNFGDCFKFINFTLKQESYVPFVVDTVKIIAKAISLYIRNDCGDVPFHKCRLAQEGFNGEKLQSYYRNLSLKENEPPLIDANGDGLGKYDIFQLDINGVYQNVGNWKSADSSNLFLRNSKIMEAFKRYGNEELVSVCSVDCGKGYYRTYQDQTCCWACIPCDKTTSIHNMTSCTQCELGKQPDASLSRCIPLTPVSMKWNTTWSLIPAVFSALGIALTIFVVSVFLRFSNTPVIMASGRELCYCMMAGIGMCYILTFLLVSTPTVTTCALTRILMGLSMSAIYAAIITKTNRLARVFKPDSAQRPRFITPKAQVGICLAIVSFQLVGTLIWLIFDPPGTKIVYPSRSIAVLTCNATTSHLLISLSYNLLLIVACTVYAFKTRKIPENFNETRHIGFTMYSTCILWLAFGPIYFATQSDFRIQITSLCMCISLSGTVALICFFAPKVYIVLFQPYKNVRTRQSAVGRLVNQQMRFMSQLTYNPDGCNNYQPISSNQSYKPSTEESSHTSSAPVAPRAIPPQVIEQLASKLPVEKNEVVKKLSLQDKPTNNNNNVNKSNDELRRRRPSSMHATTATISCQNGLGDLPNTAIVRQDTIKSHASLVEEEEPQQVDLILEEIAADTNSTFL